MLTLLTCINIEVCCRCCCYGKLYPLFQQLAPAGLKHLMLFIDKEVPRVHVTKPGVLQHGQNFTMTCNLTNTGRVNLDRISWFKNEMLLQVIRYPDPSSPEDFLPPLVIKDAGTKDEGIYTCVLEVRLRNFQKYNVTDVAVITGE